MSYFMYYYICVDILYCYDMCVTVKNYLGGVNVFGVSGEIGRFTPAYFDIVANVPELAEGNTTTGCDVIYQGDQFGFSTNVAP